MNKNRNFREEKQVEIIPPLPTPNRKGGFLKRRSGLRNAGDKSEMFDAHAILVPKERKEKRMFNK